MRKNIAIFLIMSFILNLFLFQIIHGDEEIEGRSSIFDIEEEKVNIYFMNDDKSEAKNFQKKIS